MSKLRNTAVYILLFMAVTCLPYAASAQGFEDDLEDDVTDMPLDGGATLLAAGAFSYMLKKMAEKKLQKENN